MSIAPPPLSGGGSVRWGLMSDAQQQGQPDNVGPESDVAGDCPPRTLFSMVVVDSKTGEPVRLCFDRSGHPIGVEILKSAADESSGGSGAGSVWETGCGFLNGKPVG